MNLIYEFIDYFISLIFFFFNVIYLFIYLFIYEFIYEFIYWLSIFLKFFCISYFFELFFLNFFCFSFFFDFFFLKFSKKKKKKEPLDIPTVLAYAKSKNIGVWLYVNDSALEKYLNDILERFVSWGIKGIKFGFVRISTSKDVERILGYVRLCAQYKLMVNIHDILRPTGYSR